MKNSILSLFTIALLIVSCKNGSKEKQAVPTIKKEITSAKKEVIYEVDTNKSILNWKGFKPTGSHNGTIDIKRGKVILDNNRLSGW